MKNKKLGLGAVESPHDWRHEVASSLATISTPIVLPKSFDTELGPVQMQDHIPACVSFSMVEILKLYWFGKTGKWIDFSPRFLDIMAKRTDGQDRADGGTFPSLVIKLMVKYGCATTKTLANDVSLSVLDYRNDEMITQEVLDEAAKYKIPGYIKVNLDFQSLRQAIYYYGAVSLLFRVGDTMYVPSWLPKDTDPLRVPKTITGGHQMTGKGWADDVLNKIRNEWSIAWGNKGETEYNTKDWASLITEAWAIAELPEDITNFLNSLPKAGEFHYIWTKDMKIGDVNDDVKFAQIAFMILGFLEPIPPDQLGHFGPKTSAANLKYQISKGIKPTAGDSIGPKTRSALNQQFAI